MTLKDGISDEKGEITFEIEIPNGFNSQIKFTTIAINGLEISSKNERKIVSDEILQKVAEITGVSLEDLKTMEEPMSIYIENNSTNTIEKGANVGSVNSSYDENDNDFETTYHVNPIDKITELYERLLKADQEKIKELEQRIAELEGNASKS